MKLVCVKYHKFLHPKKIGVAYEEGQQMAGAWKPYKLFQGDVLECRACGYEVILPAGEAVAEHHQPEYSRLAEMLQPMLLIEDC